MVANDVPIEGDKIISVKELLYETIDDILNQFSSIKQTNSCFQFINNLFNMKWNSNFEEGEYSKVSDMEMSIHGGNYKSDYTNKINDKFDNKNINSNEDNNDEDNEDEVEVIFN